MLVSMLTSAFALSCVTGVNAANIRDGAIVPANATLLLGHTFEAGEELDVDVLDADGQPVDGQMDVQLNHAVFLPTVPLQPGVYTLNEGSYGYPLTTFTVTDEIDSVSPAAPRFAHVERHSTNSEWGRSMAIEVAIEADPDAGHYVYQVSTDPSFASPIEVTHPAPSRFIGHGPCNNTAPDYVAGLDYHVRVRAVDVAGNSSDWSLYVAPEVPPEVASGCSTPASAGSFLLVGLAGLLLRRRPS